MRKDYRFDRGAAECGGSRGTHGLSAGNPVKTTLCERLTPMSARMPSSPAASSSSQAALTIEGLFDRHGTRWQARLRSLRQSISCLENLTPGAQPTP